MRISSKQLEGEFSFNKIPHNPSWDNDPSKELRMHKIHVYPAKFPSFLISKALKYAKRNTVEINKIGDIFCGCGTTALEAKRNNKEFWGCDINPVATLIATVKSQKYDDKILLAYYNKIIKRYDSSKYEIPNKFKSNQRIKYWFHLRQINKLHRLLKVIKDIVPKGKDQDFFLVAFSNILKGSSKWLTKSIKPTIDKNKPVYDVRTLFEKQFTMMLKAVGECNDIIGGNNKREIINSNFLNVQNKTPFLDMLITSPPYVTSYEYADLHQLSSMWLGYTKDFRTLREGTIGSVYHQTISDTDIQNLNNVGTSIYGDLLKTKKSKPKSVAKYFIDINNTVVKSHSMIRNGGLAVFVVGNTKYRGVYVDNAKYLVKCMFDKGFEDIDVYKRRISSKMLSPYRDKDGKFSNDKRKRKVYSYEFIIIAKKN